MTKKKSKEEDPKFSALGKEAGQEEAVVDAEMNPLKVGDQVIHGAESVGPVMTIENINDGVVTCVWQVGEETCRDDFSLLDFFQRCPSTLEEVAQADYRPTEIVTIKELCKVFITDAEYKGYAQQMAEAGRNISRAEDELAAGKSKYKSRIDAEVARRNEISSIISMGWEDRQVDCQLIKDYSAGEVYKVRLDTGEEFGRRNMTSDERQRGLFITESAAVAEEAYEGLH